MIRGLAKEIEKPSGKIWQTQRENLIQ